MKDLQTKSSLSPAQKRLVELLQIVNFGTIENLFVRAGDPVFEPAPKVIRSIKVGGENGARRELALADFALRDPVIELFQHLRSIRDGKVTAIQIRCGLPCQIIVEQPLD